MLTTKTKLIPQIHLRAPVCINQIITPIENLVENIVDQKADNVTRIVILGQLNVTLIVFVCI